VGRKSSDVLLVAVTKMVEPARVLEAVEAGVRCLGENRVQEAKAKIDELGKIAEWHLIGTLQRNKAKYAVRLFDMIQSVDSISLALELEKRAAHMERRIDVLLEVKTSPEESKHGVAPQDLERLVEEVLSMEHLHFRGLMTIAPYAEDPELARPAFSLLRELKQRLEDSLGVFVEHLSMGMSGDFDVAVQEGATMVRIGTAIFGARCYKH
jgi:pyridoxal phosphate enzyme (YggS family)